MVKDKNGNVIIAGSIVTMPEPTSDDLWNHSFTGVVDGFRVNENLVCVTDGDGDFWDIEPERLIIE